MPLLEIRGLSVAIADAEVVSGLDLTLTAGKTLALVGESGCGKSITALATMGLLPRAARRTQGAITLAGTELTALDEAGWRALRGNRVSMIFQDPGASLNPLLTIQSQLVEAIRAHRKVGATAARNEALKLLRLVGIADPQARLRQYPFELSGGMCQRVMVAIALACRPALLIADEPTTALDVTIQAQILELIKQLRRELETAVLLITHDLGVVADMADSVAVMYAGRVVELAPVEALFRRPLHPYTRLLLESMPRLELVPKSELHVIDGQVPEPRHWPPGCRFAPRCPLADDRCRREVPVTSDAGGGQRVACWHADDPLP